MRPRAFPPHVLDRRPQKAQVFQFAQSREARQARPLHIGIVQAQPAQFSQPGQMLQAGVGHLGA
ncbi:MAG TPA: hypothetical protein VG672_08520, partial [Bryobacteraceae bacterium]|nr:hypothetical protein [Bryobacteraceae bacterium]